MKRTTIALEAELLRQLKLQAAQTSQTLQKTVNDLLRQALRAPKVAYRLELPRWEAKQNPSLDVSDRNSIFDLLEGGGG